MAVSYTSGVGAMVFARNVKGMKKYNERELCQQLKSKTVTVKKTHS